MPVETESDRLAMLADWDSASIAGRSFPVVFEEPFAEDVGALGQSPEMETTVQEWNRAGGDLGVTVTVKSSTGRADGDFVAREVRVLDDGAMVRVRLERV